MKPGMARSTGSGSVGGFIAVCLHPCQQLVALSDTDRSEAPLARGNEYRVIRRRQAQRQLHAPDDDALVVEVPGFVIKYSLWPIAERGYAGGWATGWSPSGETPLPAGTDVRQFDEAPERWVRLMSDYGSTALWATYGSIGPEHLNLPAALAAELQAWQASWTGRRAGARTPRHSGTATRACGCFPSSPRSCPGTSSS